ncbi:hypothetical protein A2602_01300 [candidate division WWE3 bacterium RIFOXYD1_FULL_40_11]|nr:MAG: hypothetical protein A2602_01300 [candidate division WWE3 bacterium RIFOXYD1_FULL_40_11]
MLLILVAAGAGFSALVSYDVINLDNEKLQNQISGIFFKVPLFPKSAKYVLNTFILAQSTVTKPDLEVILKVDDLTGLIGGLPEDLYSAKKVILKGSVDFSDRSNPKFKFDTQVDGAVKGELFLADRALLGRLTEMDSWVYDYLEISDENQNFFLNKWVLFPEAGEALSQDTNFLEKLSEIGRTRKDKMSLTTNEDSYRIAISLDDKDISDLSITSSAIQPKSVLLELLIDKNTYYLKKLGVVSLCEVTLDPKKYGINISQDQVATELTFDLSITQNNPNSETGVGEIPQYISKEEYLSSILPHMGIISVELDTTKFVEASYRMEVLKKELLAYYETNKSFPNNLSLLEGLESGFIFADVFYSKSSNEKAILINEVPIPEGYLQGEDAKIAQLKPYFSYVFQGSLVPSQVLYSVDELAAIYGSEKETTPSVKSPAADSPFGGLLN